MSKNKEAESNIEDKVEPKGKKKSATQKLKDQIEELELQVSESKDKYLRLFAEFDNFKKRNMKERLDILKSASQETLSSLLPVLDDFDRAKKSADDDASQEQFSEGVTMVYNKIYNVVSGKGLKKMESTGEVFDPEPVSYTHLTLPTICSV